MKERNYSIDLLRIISMDMIIMLHIYTQGGVFNGIESGSINYYFSIIVLVILYSATNIYAIISGYIGGRRKVSKLLTLYVQVWVYSAVITILMRVLFPDVVGTRELVSSFFPVTMNQYWYFSAYTGMYLLLLVFGDTIEKITKKQLAIIVCLLLTVASFSCVSGYDTFHFVQGHSVIWLVSMYLVGVYIRKYGFGNLSLSKIKIIGICASFMSAIAFYIIGKAGISQQILSRWFISFTSPSVIIVSVCIFLCFAQFDIKCALVQKLALFFSSTSFGVYLIHTNHSVFTLLKDSLKVLSTWGGVIRICVIILLSMGIYLLCTGIDYCRSVLFACCGISKRIHMAEEKIIEYWR